MPDDERAIDALVHAFFDRFTNRRGARPDLAGLFDLCIPEAVITRCVTASPEVMSLEAFIAPRQALLSGGSLVDFQEVELAHRTDVFGNVAQRCCTYRKSGVLNGSRFETIGVKMFQFVRRPEGWRISAVSWDDEREGFSPEWPQRA